MFKNKILIYKLKNLNNIIILMQPITPEEEMSPFRSVQTPLNKELPAFGVSLFFFLHNQKMIQKN